jgi:hypothetical protein
MAIARPATHIRALNRSCSTRISSLSTMLLLFPACRPALTTQLQNKNQQPLNNAAVVPCMPSPTLTKRHKTAKHLHVQQMPHTACTAARQALLGSKASSQARCLPCQPQTQPRSAASNTRNITRNATRALVPSLRSAAGVNVQDVGRMLRADPSHAP